MARKLTREEFIQRATEVHGNVYDYSNVVYKNARTKVNILCPVHKEFQQTPMNHLKGKGCMTCSYEGGRKKKTPLGQAIERAREVHGDVYDYSNVSFDRLHDTVIIGCPIHGEFEQSLSAHISQKQGCPSCGYERRAQQKRSDNESFIHKAREVHGDKYNYSKTNYTKTHEPVTITCKIHGDFQQLPSNHLKYFGCRKCSSGSGLSLPEQELQDFINSLGISDVEYNNRTVISPKELDVYLPSHSVAIEFDGLYWHSVETNTPKKYHLSKTVECLNKGVHLIHVFQNEWEFQKEIVKSRLMSVLNLQTNRVYARKCVVRQLTIDEERDFFEKTHIQGYVASSVCWGLFYEGSLVAAMSFGKPRFNRKFQWELLRYSTKKYTSVVGGAGKLLTAFKKEQSPKSIITYADRRWSNGNLYNVLGFQLAGESQPNYYYFHKNSLVLENRMKYQKHKLPKVLESFDGSLTEQQNMSNNGYHRIYDCGNLIYVWNAV